MSVFNVTAPAGRRMMAFGSSASRTGAANADVRSQSGSGVDKWLVYRQICTARKHWGLPDRAMMVLQALLSFHPEQTLKRDSDTNLTVFPSNATLSLRAAGMADSTLRRHLAALVEAGLIGRVDSPNNKRYVRREKSGAITHAYGFDLTPLIQNATAIAAAADHVQENRKQAAIAREAISLLKRDINQMLAAENNSLDCAARQNLLDRMHATLASLRPTTPINVLKTIQADMTVLAQETAIATGALAANTVGTEVTEYGTAITESGQLEEISNSDQNDAPPFGQIHGGSGEQEGRNDLPSAITSNDGNDLLGQGFFKKLSTNACQIERHKEVSNTEVIFDTKINNSLFDDKVTLSRKVPQTATPQSQSEEIAIADKDFTLVLRACRTIADYARHGITSLNDLLDAAERARLAIHISDSAWREGRLAIGPVNRAIAIAVIVQMGEGIANPGGYFRTLVRQASQTGLRATALLKALMRQKVRQEKQHVHVMEKDFGQALSPAILPDEAPDAPPQTAITISDALRERFKRMR